MIFKLGWLKIGNPPASAFPPPPQNTMIIGMFCLAWLENTLFKNSQLQLQFTLAGLVLFTFSLLQRADLMMGDGGEQVLVKQSE